MPLTVEIWSDVLCPWCYIGKRRFERAAEALSDVVELSVRYRAFQLDPTAPVDTAQPVVDAYAKKFGGIEVAHQMIERVTTMAAAEGVEFHMDRALRANTLRAHQLLADAAETDTLGVAQSDLKERLLQAYFVDGINIGDIDALADCVTDIGGDADAARNLLATNSASEAVVRDLEMAAEYGITAVPTFVVDGRWSIPGAQDSDTFITALTRIADQKQADSE